MSENELRRLLDKVFELCLKYSERNDVPIELVTETVGRELAKFAKSLNLN